MSRRLTDAQVGAYRRSGFVFPLPALSTDEARRYRDACDVLEVDLGGKPRTIDVRQMHLHFSWAFELATRPAILDAIEDILGPNLLIWATELFTKHTQDNRISVNWHRDGPYLGLIGGASTTAWVALSPSNEANGCMFVLPRPDGAEGEVNASGDNSRHTPPIPDIQAIATAVTLTPGQMSLHAADVVHGSGPSRSSEKRVGFVIRFVTPEARPVHGRPPVVLVRGSDRIGHFTLVPPPVGEKANRDLAAMRESAVRHLDVVLENFKRVDHQRRAPQ